MQAFRSATFFKSGSNTGVSCGYCQLFQNSFFYRKPPEAASDSPTTVQWSQQRCFLFDFVSSHAFKLDFKLTQNVARINLYYQVTKPFLSWIILSSVFDFRICFGETLVAFYFDEKFTQSIAQITMLYHVSKDFFCLHFALAQFQDMTWKSKNAV